jgi:hypothetical protein
MDGMYIAEIPDLPEGTIPDIVSFIKDLTIMMDNCYDRENISFCF